MKTFIVVLAVFAVAAHVWFSRTLYHGPNEAVLTGAVESVGNDFEGVSINYQYLDGTLQGFVKSKAEKLAVEQIVRKRILAGRVINHLTIRAPTLPASLDADWTGKAFVLQGRVPSEKHRKELGDAFLTLNIGQVDNQIAVNPEVMEPKWLEKLSAFPAVFFTRNVNQPARLELDEDQVRLKSSVLDGELKRDLLTSAESLGLPVVDEITIIPKKTCRLSASLSEKLLRLEGLVPSETFADRLEKSVTETGSTVTNQLRIESHSETPKWGQHAAEFLSVFLADTPFGKLEMEGNRILLNRLVTHYEEKESWIRKVELVLPGAEIVDQMKFSTETRAFNFALKRKGNTVFLEGWLPSLRLKNRIIAAAKARFAGAQIDSQIFAAPSVSMPEWGDALPDFISSIPPKGDFSLVRFHGEGVVLPKKDREEWVKLARNSIGKKFPSFIVPEFAFFLTKQNRNIYQLRGWLPSDGLKKRSIDRFKSKFPGVRIKDEVKVDTDLSLPQWGNALPDFLGSLPGVDDISSLGIDLNGLQLPKLPAGRAIEIKKLAREIFGEEFPGLDLPTIPPPPLAPDPVPAPNPGTTLMTKVDSGSAPANRPPKSIAPVASSRSQPKPASTQVPWFQTISYPASFFVELKGDEIRLIGNVPTEKMKKAIGSTVASARPGIKLSNLLHVDKRVIPPSWEKQLPDLLGDFLQGSSGAIEFEIDDEKVRLEQYLADDATKADFVARARALLPRGKLIDQLSTPNSRPYQFHRDQFPARPRPMKYVVYFSTGSSRVNSAGLREVNYAARNFARSGRSVAVRGFADGRGNAAFNKRLSEARALAVVDQLVSKGVRRSAIRYDGVGESQSRESDIQEDRRVEITIE